MTTTPKRSAAKRSAPGRPAALAQQSLSRPAEPAPIDATRWPDVATVPDGRLRATSPGACSRASCSRLAVQVPLPDGAGLRRRPRRRSGHAAGAS